MGNKMKYYFRNSNQLVSVEYLYHINSLIPKEYFYKVDLL